MAAKDSNDLLRELSYSKLRNPVMRCAAGFKRSPKPPHLILS
jgi:hypothetical protein